MYFGAEGPAGLRVSVHLGGLLGKSVPPSSDAPCGFCTSGAQTSPNLVWGLLSPARSIAFLCYTLPACFCSLPDMCFVLATPKIKSWLESMLSNSEGAFHFPVRSGSFKHLSSSHFRDENRRKQLLLCLENIINCLLASQTSFNREHANSERSRGLKPRVMSCTMRLLLVQRCLETHRPRGCIFILEMKLGSETRFIIGVVVEGFLQA